MHVIYTKKKNCITLLTCFILAFCTSAQNFKLQNIEVDFNENFIGRSMQLQLQAKTRLLNVSLGIRYHLKIPTQYHNGQLYLRTMYPIKKIQHFGPTFAVTYHYQPKDFYAAFFAGYKGEVGIMARRFVLVGDIFTRTSTYLHTKSPMVRWENQLILGATLPIIPKIKFRIYGGAGIAALFNIVEENVIFPEAPNGKMTEFSASFGCGLSYQLFGKNALKIEKLY